LTGVLLPSAIFAGEVALWAGTAGCVPRKSKPKPVVQTKTLAETRRGFTSRLMEQVRGSTAAPTPPPQVIKGRGPAVIWLGDEDHNTLTDRIW